MLKPADRIVRRFLSDENGAVTVDWVVLTAAVVGLAIAVFGIIRTGATDPSSSIGAFLANYEMDTSL